MCFLYHYPYLDVLRFKTFLFDVYTPIRGHKAFLNGYQLSKLFVKSGAFHILCIHNVAHALNNAYLHTHAHDSLVYCHS